MLSGDQNFYIFRHGQTDVNKEERFQGQGIDAPLNEKGVAQAWQARGLLSSKKLEIIYSSPLVRAQQTAEIISGGDVPIVLNAAFIEGNFGSAEGVFKSGVKARDPKLYDEWRDMTNLYMSSRFPGGESKQEIQARFLAGVQEILKSEHKNVGISSHSAAIRYFLMHFGEQVNVPNAGVVHLVYNSGKLDYKGMLAPQPNLNPGAER